MTGQLSEVAMVASDLQGATVGGEWCCGSLWPLWLVMFFTEGSLVLPGKLPSILCKEDAVSAASSMSMVSSVRFQDSFWRRDRGSGRSENGFHTCIQLPTQKRKEIKLFLFDTIAVTFFFSP